MASKLTEKKAIHISKELWAWLAETGEEKEGWPGWEKYGEMAEDCALCEYDSIHWKPSMDDRCYCPYYRKFGHCNSENMPFNLWDEAELPKDRKKYAKLFLEQLETL